MSPTILGLYYYSLTERTVIHVSSPALCGLFIIFFCLSERLVMYDGYPYSVSGKLSIKFWGRKKVPESTYRGCQRGWWCTMGTPTLCLPPPPHPMVWFGLTPMYGYTSTVDKIEFRNSPNLSSNVTPCVVVLHHVVTSANHRKLVMLVVRILSMFNLEFIYRVYCIKLSGMFNSWLHKIIVEWNQLRQLCSKRLYIGLDV